MPKSEVIQDGALRSIFKKAARTECLAFRLSRQDKSSIRKAARSVNVSMTDYLLNLHRFAVMPANQTRPTIVGGEGARVKQ